MKAQQNEISPLESNLLPYSAIAGAPIVDTGMTLPQAADQFSHPRGSDFG